MRWNIVRYKDAASLTLCWQWGWHKCAVKGHAVTYSLLEIVGLNDCLAGILRHSLSVNWYDNWWNCQVEQIGCHWQSARCGCHVSPFGREKSSVSHPLLVMWWDWIVIWIMCHSLSVHVMSSSKKQNKGAVSLTSCFSWYDLSNTMVVTYPLIYTYVAWGLNRIVSLTIISSSSSGCQVKHDFNAVKYKSHVTYTLLMISINAS